MVTFVAVDAIDSTSSAIHAQAVALLSQGAEPTIAHWLGVCRSGAVCHGFRLTLSALTMLLQPRLWWYGQCAPLADAIGPAAESGVPGGVAAR